MVESRKEYRGNNILREGEVDFVIVLPELGFLVLKVKGGQIEYDSTSHLWFRLLLSRRKKEITNPFEQARKNMHFLADQISDAPN